MIRSRFVIAGAAGAAMLWLMSGLLSAADVPAERQLNILYPKDRALVGRRVNVVVDPMSDFSAWPFLQVVVGNKEYPLVDTSSGRHAAQGLPLEPGVNTVAVRGLARVPGGKDGLSVAATRTITVFNREESFGALADGFEPHVYHSRDQEADCSGCHRLDVEQQDLKYKKPEDVLCFACHREVVNARAVHGPAAVWNCLVCHDHEMYPAKYQFTAVNPWTATKSTQPVEPVVFTLAADDLFKPLTAVLVSDDVPRPSRSKGMPKGKLLQMEKARQEEIKTRKERERSLFSGVLEYLKQNPADKLYVEAHVDDSLPSAGGAMEKGKKKPQPVSPKKLTADRAKATARLLNKLGVSGANRIIAVGMGSGLPKAANTSPEGRAINNRIVIVAHPADVKVRNSMSLPQLKDRERVIVNITYSAKGPGVRDLKVTEYIPKGAQYIKGSSVVRGTVKEPQVKANELRWQLGDVAPDYQGTLSFVVKKTDAAAPAMDPVVRLAYRAGKNEETRNIDPLKPEKGGLTVRQTCEKCHVSVASEAYRHGPVEAGYCNLCHDPHGSNFPAWTRKSSWKLCTTCHTEKATGVHVIAGMRNGAGHPTANRRDPTRPGKKLACISCHSPHGAGTREFLKFGVTQAAELCVQCHKRKM